MRSATEVSLALTALGVGLSLLVAQRLLARRGLFNWTTAGFWAWLAFGLYFVVTPLAVLASNDRTFYDVRLAVAGGQERGLWVLAMVLVGIAAFYWSYFRVKYRVITARRDAGEQLSLPMVVVLTGALVISALSLLTFRAEVLSPSGETVIVGGRFVGDVTGYETIAFMFAFVPVMMLVLSRSRARQAAGLTLAAAFVLLSLPNGWARYATLSMIIGITVALALRARRHWPPVILMAAIVLAGAAFQLRGHETWSLENSGQSLVDLLAEVPTAGASVFAGADTAMLGTFYVESYLKDTWTGFDYSLPALNYILTGWVPGRIFPDKYFLVDWLRSTQNKAYPPYLDDLLYGAKSSLIGSFYANGGVIAVVLEMVLMGWLSRRLDGMLAQGSPLIVRALGVSWLSTVWMIWGSHDFWGIMLTGALAIPAVAVWLVSPRSRHVEQSIDGEAIIAPELKPIHRA